MSKINLHEFKSKDLWGKLSEAGDFLRSHPGSTLLIDPGEYVLTTPLAREEQECVMNGTFGEIPQVVMFNPDYKYDRGLDLDGVNGCKIEAYGVRFTVDGFMEPISIRNCKNVEIFGLTIDHKRKPYSRGTVKSYDGEKITVEFGEDFPITDKIPFMRSCICDESFTKLEKLFDIVSMTAEDSFHATFQVKNMIENPVGREIYIWHTYHSRPAFLIEYAQNTHLKDVTVHSQPGMGVTAHASTDIFFERLRVEPSEGECLATNTDATHITSCRGKVKYDGCYFYGQGDDGLDCHTYYHTILECNGKIIKCKAYPNDGTHTQVPDVFRKGDTLLKVKQSNLAPKEEFTAVSVEVVDGVNIVELDRDFGDTEGYFVADRNSLPELTLRNCTMKNHLARGALIKCPKVLVENCTIEGTFDQALKIAAESSWREGIGTDDVVVRGCNLIGCGHRENFCGGITMYSESPERDEDIHKKITIENCRIECPNAKQALYLKNVTEIVERNNTLIFNK